jgi:benzylsuccinate CoA-transferase BbsF subunit
MKTPHLSKGPLAGLRVADFTWIGAGSYTTKILADFGAEVIKVESSTRLDPLRNTAPFFEGKPGVNRSGYFADRNSNKKSMVLDLKKEKAQEIARSLIDKSDVVTNNFSPGTMEKLGLGYEQVRKNHEELVYLSMSMQGSSGPHSHYVGFGLTIAALSGIQYLSGPHDRAPVGTGTNYPDHVPNPCHAAFALLAAIYRQRKNGQGQFIDFAQTEPTISLIGSSFIDAHANHRLEKRMGNDNLQSAPRGAYPCRDGQTIAIAVYTDQHWLDLDALLHVSAHLPDRNWQSIDVRMAYRPELDSAISKITTGLDAESLQSQLQLKSIPSGVACNIAQLVDNDPQLKHRQHWIELNHPEMGQTIYNAPPIRLSRTNFNMEKSAPLLGEHTDEVCKELLGLSEDEIKVLREQGIFV